MKIKSIILGASGYLGKHLRHHLKHIDHDVICFDYLKEKYNADGVCHFDITNSEDVQKINWSVDYIFLFSGLTGTKESFEKYDQFVEINEIGLLNVLNSIKNLQNKPKIIFPSSRLVYKGSDSPLHENAEKETKTIYALNKLTCEKILDLYNKTFGIDYSIFRICIPYGSHYNDYSFGTISFMLNQAKKNGEITLFGDGQLKRTFTHIDDICEQIICTSLNETSNNEIFNIGGETYSLNEVAECICKLTSAKISYKPWPKMDLLIESGSTIFDDVKIRRYFTKNYKPLIKWLQ